VGRRTAHLWEVKKLQKGRRGPKSRKPPSLAGVAYVARNDTGFAAKELGKKSEGNGGSQSAGLIRAAHTAPGDKRDRDPAVERPRLPLETL